MKPTHWILYFFCLPWDLTICWPFVCLIRLTVGMDLHWEWPPVGSSGPVLVVILRPDSWVAKKWYQGWGGTTFGHGMMYAEGESNPANQPESPVQVHENVHVEQFEGAAVGGFILGLVTFVVVGCLGHWAAAVQLGMFIWWSSWVVVGIGNIITAWLRGENPYRGASHEEAAYAQEGLYEEGKSANDV